MLKYVFGFAFLFVSLSSIAQENPYLDDLHALRTILRETPSFKAQVTGTKRQSFDELFKRLSADTVTVPNSFRYFSNLSRLFFPLRDNHLAFYQLPDYENFKSREAVNAFLHSPEFLAYPASKLNLDSLESVLAKSPRDSIEGIYHYDTFYTVGLHKVSEHELTGVVLHSNVSIWPRGHLAIHLYEYQPGLYKAIYGHPSTKAFRLQSNEKFRSGSLVNSFFYGSYSAGKYSKRPGAVDHVSLPPRSPHFRLQSLNDSVQYLLVRSFQATPAMKRRSKSFYDSIQHLLTAPYLLLDLRNNEGGSKFEAKKYLDLLNRFSKKGRLYIIVNNQTISQAEIVAIRLRKKKNVVTVGQPTNGMLTYGSNYGRRKRLPASNAEVYITDMRGKPGLLKYEDVGLQPDITLDDDNDFIAQVLELIQGN